MIRLLGLAMACVCLMQSAAWGMGVQPFFKDSFLNLQEDAAEAAKAGRLLMVLFEQEGCPYCLQLHKQHFADPVIVSRLKQHFDVVQLDLWGSRETVGVDGKARTEKQLARELRVQFSPTILFLDGKGREVYRMSGLHAPPVFQQGLDYVAERAYVTLRFSEYAKASAKPKTVERVFPFYATGNDLPALLASTQAEDKILMLYFAQTDCGECQEMTARHFAPAQNSALLSRRFVVKRIDAQGQKRLVDLGGKPQSEAELTARMGVSQTPTLMFFDRTGMEILRYEEHMQPKHFANGLLEFLHTHAYRQHASLQDWLRARATSR